MKQQYYVVDTKFSGNICQQYSLYNQQLTDLSQLTVYDSVKERRILEKIDIILQGANITKDEFTRIALIFRRHRKVIFLVDYFEPLAKTLHSFLGFKSQRRCNIIFTYEILKASLSDVLYAKYFFSEEDLEDSVIVISNTSSRYFDLFRRLSKTQRPETQTIVLLTPKETIAEERLRDRILWRGFICSAMDSPEESELIYLV